MTETPRQYKVRRRRRLFDRQSGKCHWCACEMCLPEDGIHTKNPPKNMATIDHLRDRFHPYRQEPNWTGERRWVLACWTCNNERGKARQQEFVDLQRVKSTFGHLTKRRAA